MTWCSSCALELSGSAALCSHHVATYDGWAVENRIICNLIHRGVEPPRLAKEDREEEIVAWVD